MFRAAAVKELARQLLDHLNENIERYHHVIWWRMSPDRRYMLLDGFQAPHAAGRSVASVVENELKMVAEEAVASLGEREREILAHRFGLDGRKPLTLEALGTIFNISKERVRQIEKRALTKLIKLPIVASAKGIEGEDN